MFGVSSEVVAPATLGSFFFLAAYLNLNDPDWALWSTAYVLGALICVWTALQGGGGGGGEAATAAESADKDVSWARRYGAAPKTPTKVKKSNTGEHCPRMGFLIGRACFLR